MGDRLRRFFARHRYALGIGALVSLTAPLGIRSRPLWVGDETREAAIAKQMADSGDFLQTRLAGLAVVEKPPFYAIEVLSGVIGTKGGILTDNTGRALDAFGDVVPGLLLVVLRERLIDVAP